MNDRQSAAGAHHLPIAFVTMALALLSFALIVLAGNGPVATTCSGWADCSSWTTLTDRPNALETWRLGLSGGIGLLTLVMTALIRVSSSSHKIARVVTIATGLAAVQFAAIVASANVSAAPRAAAIHLGATALLLATLVYLLSVVVHRPCVVGRTRDWTARNGAALTRVRWLVATTSLALFGVLVSGAYYTSSSVGVACTRWPTCGNEVTISSVLRPDLAMFHRELVLLTGFLLLGVAIAALRAARDSTAIRWLVGLLLAAYVAEVAIGGWSATRGYSDVADGMHFAVAGVVWVLLVGFAILISDGINATRTVTGTSLGTASSSVARDYFRVMKPGIMVLLLTTTLGAMLIAGAGSGWPSAGLILATLLGGVLASGGASALNCYLDRDIDVVMARTRKRPLPTGRLSPAQVRNFGLILSVLAAVELALLVNPLAALLALCGNVYYVVLYTRYLKRATPQNIVIGGGAGAFPPLVGWAAVTGSLGLTPLLLFALIYYWTPPHFWSLALLKARDYERASIPMLPVTHGEAQTRKFILIYSFMLLGITLLLAPASGAGIVYLGAALALGAVFIGYAARMFLEDSTRLAWPLFKYSNYYLALILLALVIDRSLGM